MDLKFIVNRASVHPREVTTEWKGEQAKMTMSELEVELVDPEGTHGSFTLHFSGTAEVEEAARFVSGATVTVPLSAFQVTSAPKVEAAEEA